MIDGEPDAPVVGPLAQLAERGVEIEGAVADGPQSVIQEQVTHGLAIRMAVLALIHRHIGHEARV